MSQLVRFALPVLFVVTFLQSAFSMLSPVFSYSDELFVAVVLISGFMGGKIKRHHFPILIALIVFGFYSLFTSFVSPYFRGVGLTILDLLLFSKPILLYIGMMHLPSRAIGRFLAQIKPFAYLYLFSAFVMFFVNVVITIFPATDQRFGVNSYSFIANNPGEFANLIFASGVLIYGISRSSYMRMVSVGVMIFLSLASLRFKAIVLSAIYISLIFVRRIGLMERKVLMTPSRGIITSNRVRPSYLLAILPFGLALGAGQFIQYFFSELTPRLFLVQQAIVVAGKFFPFGAGGGTFGSAVSKILYSPLYHDLGFAGRWGLTEADGRFLSDNFWPMVVAQYGILGTGIVLVIYTLILKDVLRQWAGNHHLAIGALIIGINLAISTLGSAILIGNIGVVLITTLILLVRKT